MKYYLKILNLELDLIEISAIDYIRLLNKDIKKYTIINKEEKRVTIVLTF